MADGDRRDAASLADMNRALKRLFLVPVGVSMLVAIALLILGLFQNFWPDSWFADLPVQVSFGSAEAVEESSVLYHDDDSGLVWISYSSQLQKHTAIQKWHNDFPDRWNRQIWEDAEDGVVIIAYVP